MRLITLLFLSTLIAYPAFAEDDPGFYVGASVGQASLDGTVRGDLVPFSIAVDDEDTLWGVTVGYDTGKWFSLELGYVDLGETSNTVNAFGAFGLFGVIDFALLAPPSRANNHLGARLDTVWATPVRVRTAFQRIRSSPGYRPCA